MKGLGPRKECAYCQKEQIDEVVLVRGPSVSGMSFVLDCRDGVLFVCIMIERAAMQ